MNKEFSISHAANRKPEPTDTNEPWKWPSQIDGMNGLSEEEYEREKSDEKKLEKLSSEELGELLVDIHNEEGDLFGLSMKVENELDRRIEEEERLNLQWRG